MITGIGTGTDTGRSSACNLTVYGRDYTYKVGLGDERAGAKVNDRHSHIIYAFPIESMST